MHITHMAGTFPKSSETFIMNQLGGLIDKGHKIQLFANSEPDDRVRHSIVEQYELVNKTRYVQQPSSYIQGIEQLVDVVPDLLRLGYSPYRLVSQFRHGKAAPRRLGNIRAAYRHIDQTDILHAHFGPVGNAFLPIQQPTGLPLVVSFYGYDISSVPQSDPSVYNDLFETATVVTCLSEDMKQDLLDLGAPTKKIRKVPLCIDPDTFEYRERELTSDNPDEPLQILTVARHVEKKGLEYAIRAVAQLDIDRPVTYRIAGDGPLRDQLENLISELDAADRIEILGWQTQDEVAQLMTDAHVFLLPSVTAANGDKEGTPTVLLEAQATGLPVVSTTHAGIPEIVSDGDTGILVPERDVTALVDALEDILTQPKEWAAMGRTGREYIEERHSIESVTDELVSIYESAT
jgi:colanic acid/amylovoran biosynthesis glycosyltransferase